MSDETFMLTGSMGCIGAWALRNLVREGVRVVATDLATDPLRPRQVMSAEELSHVEFAKLDVTDLNAVKKMVASDPKAIGYIEKSAVDASVKVIYTP